MLGGGGGGLNPRKMKQMMKQMGIDVEELEVEEVVIRTTDGEEMVFGDADVTKMDARGQETFQVMGDYETRTAGETDATDEEPAVEESTVEVPDADVEIVVQRTGASEADARAALEETGGDLAAAVEQLE